MNPNNDIAVDGTVVKNANLYFFSWLSFAACLFLSASLGQETAGYDVTKTPPKSARWYGLCAASLVVMGSSIRIYKNIDCGGNNDLVTGSQFCKRTKLAISIGVVGFFFAAALTYLAQRGLELVIETVATAVLLTMWCFGVGYLTFGDSPGATIGNLYFSTWIAFILTVFLFGQCFRDFMSVRAQAMSPTNNAPEANQGDDSVLTPQPQIPEDEEI